MQSSCLILLVFINQCVYYVFSSNVDIQHTLNCNQWALGYFAESCALTCNRISGACNASEFLNIAAHEAFYSMVSSSYTFCTNEATGTTDQFCNQGISTPQFAQTSSTYRTNGRKGVSKQTHSSYPTYKAVAVTDCNAYYVYPPAQRFCPCTVPCDSISHSPIPLPSNYPTVLRTMQPTTSPSTDPIPGASHTVSPTRKPNVSPNHKPTHTPSLWPSTLPSAIPTSKPAALTSMSPVVSPSPGSSDSESGGDSELLHRSDDSNCSYSISRNEQDHCIDVPVHLRWWYSTTNSKVDHTAGTDSPTTTFNDGKVLFSALAGEDDYWEASGREITIGYSGAIGKEHALDNIVLTDIKIQFFGIECNSTRGCTPTFSIVLPDQIVQSTNTSSRYITVSFNTIAIVPILCENSDASINLKCGGIFSAKVQTCGDSKRFETEAIDLISPSIAVDPVVYVYFWYRVWSGYFDGLVSSVLPTILALLGTVGGMCTVVVLSLWATEQPIAAAWKYEETPPALSNSPLRCVIVHKTLFRSSGKIRSHPYPPSTTLGATSGSHLVSSYPPSYCTTS